MTNIKRERRVMDMDGRQIPMSLAFLRDCIGDVELGSEALAFTVRGIFDVQEQFGITAPHTRGLCADYEREYFEQLKFDMVDRGVRKWSDPPEHFRRAGTRAGQRSGMLARERRSHAR